MMVFLYNLQSGGGNGTDKSAKAPASKTRDVKRHSSSGGRAKGASPSVAAGAKGIFLPIRARQRRALRLLLRGSRGLTRDELIAGLEHSELGRQSAFAGLTANELSALAFTVMGLPLPADLQGVNLAQRLPHLVRRRASLIVFGNLLLQLPLTFFARLVLVLVVSLIQNIRPFTAYQNGAKVKLMKGLKESSNGKIKTGLKVQNENAFANEVGALVAGLTPQTIQGIRQNLPQLDDATVRVLAEQLVTILVEGEASEVDEESDDEDMVTDDDAGKRGDDASGPDNGGQAIAIN